MERLEQKLKQSEGLVDSLTKENSETRALVSKSQGEVVALKARVERYDELEEELKGVRVELADTEALVESRGECIERLEEERDEVNEHRASTVPCYALRLYYNWDALYYRVLLCIMIPGARDVRQGKVPLPGLQGAD